MRRLTIVTVLALLLAACGATDNTGTTTTTGGAGNTTSPGEPFQTGELVSLDIPREEPTVSDDEIAAVTRGDAAFGLDLFRATAGDENFMISPYSIATALSMLYPGARGETAAEIAAVLHLDVSDETLHAVRNAIEQALSEEPLPVGPDDSREPFTIRPVNSAWGQGGYPFLDDYLAVLAGQYGAGLRIVDFANDPEGATETINGWVEEATEDRIEDLIPDGGIDTLTRLVLVNAIWFKANWAEQFDPDLTTQDSFALSNGDEISVPMMHGSIRTGYVSNGLFEAVRLPYAGDAAMVVAIPTDGSLADLIAALEADDLDIQWIDHQVEIAMPSFEFEAEVGLKSALQDLGMVRAFTDPLSPDGADLTGITAARELFVTDAFHKTFVAVDESGTEAAAATAIIIGLESMPQPATFTADQPFLFWIEHTTTGELLFLGQVVNPL